MPSTASCTLRLADSICAAVLSHMVASARSAAPAAALDAVEGLHGGLDVEGEQRRAEVLARSTEQGGDGGLGVAALLLHLAEGVEHLVHGGGAPPGRPRWNALTISPALSPRPFERVDGGLGALADAEAHLLERVGDVVRVPCACLGALHDQPERLLGTQAELDELVGVLVDGVDEVVRLDLLRRLDDEVERLVGVRHQPGLHQVPDGPHRLGDVVVEQVRDAWTAWR